MNNKQYLAQVNKLIVDMNIYQNKEQTRWGEEGFKHSTVDWVYKSIKLIEYAHCYVTDQVEYTIRFFDMKESAKERKLFEKKFNYILPCGN